jgi:hypothetical protein
MKKSTLILVCIAFLMVMTALAFSASALCSSCMQEGDWSNSANSFIEGTPISDVPQAFGPRVVRATTSQFENKSKTTQDATGNDANTAVTPAADTSVPEVAINLISVNASPDSVNSGSPVKITALFSVSSSTESENQTGISNNASTSPAGETLLTASAVIKNSAGKDVGVVNLVKSSGNEYSGSWNAQVPAGVYYASIFASSLQGSGNFNDALKINVAASGNAIINAPVVKNLG